jgi:hypothetical protein
MSKKMNLMNRIAICATLLAVLLIGFSAIAQEDALDAEAILDRVNSAWQGDSFHGIISLDIVLAGQTKSHKLEIWTLGEELALIRMLEPEIDFNSGYLQLDDELWYYSPVVGPVKLPAMAIGDALFGAGPSLEDLSRGTLSDNYDVSVVASPDGSGDHEGASEGHEGFFLTLIPHLDAPVVYGKLEIWVTADDVMERLIYYDQRGDVLQTAIFSDVVEVGNRKFATTIIIEDAYGDRTIERIEGLQFDLELDATFFSIETFESWGDAE